MRRLTPPELSEDGASIRSRRFDDIYFSPDDGLAETHHVFVDGNGVVDRLRASDASRPFVIGELGFGTGLNVLATWAAWEGAGRPVPLRIWSCEAYPLTREQFIGMQRRIAGRWPELASFAERLADAYPEPRPGFAQVPLEGGLQLTIAFGDAHEMLRAAWFAADAWYLDGFAPSRNPEMWTPEVLLEVARLSRPGTTAATFSVASGVRTALARAGFDWHKAPGFGRKKHMLRARIEIPPDANSGKPWFAPPAPARTGAVAVIGAGIAGATLARALLESGREVAVFDKDAPASGASGNPAGLVMPRIDADDTPASRFYRDAFLFAAGFYAEMGEEVFCACGGIISTDPEKARRVQEIGLWPRDVLQDKDGQVLVPAAGVLRPRRAIASLLGETDVIRSRIMDHRADDAGWWLEDAAGSRFGPFAAVVLCPGADSEAGGRLPVSASAGQVDVFEGPAPPRVLTDGTYVAPLGDNVVAGASYAPYDGGPLAPDAADTEANLDAATRLLGRSPGAHLDARVAVRATTADRHPLAGPLYEEGAAIAAYGGLAKGRREEYPAAPYQGGLFVLGGLGSRGLTTAPILASHVSSLVTGGVSPLAADTSGLVHPGRFLIRAIRRGEVSLA